MAFTVTVHHGPFLLVVATGEALVCDMLGLVDLSARVAEKQNYTRALFDLISVTLNLTQEEYVEVGLHAAAKLCACHRVASVVAEDQGISTSERAAQDSGLPLQTFTDLGSATQWLEES